MDKILIVYSEAQSGEAIYRKLSAMGYSTTLATSGLEALGLIYSDKFELAIIDVNSPEIEGTTLLKALKKHSPQTMAVMLAKAADSKPLTESLRLGAFDIITRPLDEEHLEKTVLAALEEGQHMRNAGYIYKDSRTNEKGYLRQGISLGILDSLLVGISFCLGFLLQGILMPNSPFIGRMELLLLSLGMTFCYAFIFVYRRSYKSDKEISQAALISELAKNLSFAYLLDLAMLFIMKDNSFLSFRTALGFGIILGLILLYAGRMASGALRYRNAEREGERRLIIAGPAPAINLIKKSSEPGRKKGSISADILSDTSIELPTANEEEVHLDSQSMSSDDLIGAIDLLQDGKTRVVIHKPAVIPREKREPVSAGH